MFNGGNKMSPWTTENLKSPDFYTDLLKGHVTYNFERYHHNHSILMFGDDFGHPNALRTYRVMDETINSMKVKYPDI